MYLHTCVFPCDLSILDLVVPVFVFFPLPMLYHLLIELITGFDPCLPKEACHLWVFPVTKKYDPFLSGPSPFWTKTHTDPLHFTKDPEFYILYETKCQPKTVSLPYFNHWAVSWWPYKALWREGFASPTQMLSGTLCSSRKWKYVQFNQHISKCFWKWSWFSSTFVFKIISSTEMQKHKRTFKWYSVNAMSTGSDITVIPKSCWSIRNIDKMTSLVLIC